MRLEQLALGKYGGIKADSQFAPDGEPKRSQIGCEVLQQRNI